jgi:hypothetical protein
MQDLEVAAVMYLWSNFRAGVLSIGRDVVRLFLTYDLKTHPSVVDLVACCGYFFFIPWVCDLPQACGKCGWTWYLTVSFPLCWTQNPTEGR